MWGQVERTSEDIHSGSLRETLLERNRQPGWRVSEEKAECVYQGNRQTDKQEDRKPFWVCRWGEKRGR